MRKLLSRLTAFLFAAVATVGQVHADNDYCDSRGVYSNYEWIQSVTVNDQAFDSGRNNGYIEHTDDVAILTPGENTIVLQPGYSFTNYTERWAAWLDRDGDGVFEEGERLFDYAGAGAKTMTFELPADGMVDFTTLRVIMRFGALPIPCGSYTYGETEDFVVSLVPPTPPEPSAPTYHLSARADFTLDRTGSLGDDLIWVFEVNGSIALKRNAASELSYRYYRNFPDNHIRAWLEQFVDGQYQEVSNIIEYVPGVTNLYELQMGTNYGLSRSGSLGESVQWVIERNGEIVLERNAANELTYTYYNNIQGSQYRVWLKQYLNGAYKVVSNTVEYAVGQTNFTLSVDQFFEIHRNGELGDPLRWVIEEDGAVVLQTAADTSLGYTYPDNKPGSSYRVWLQRFENGSYVDASNVVEYQVPASTPYTLSLGDNYFINRTGSLGDPVTWVIVKNGNVVLQRNAANELAYRYFSNTSGSTIQVYLQQFIDGYYQPVSNFIEYTVP